MINKKIFFFIIIHLIFSSFLFSQTGNWISIGGTGQTLTRLHFNSNADTLYAGTIEGYRFYSLLSSQWVIKEMPGYIGRTVWALSTVPGRPARIITGRVNAFFKGYIELNDNFSIQGTIVRNSQGGKFTDIKYFFDHPDTMLACAFSDITPGDLAKSTNGGTNWTLITAYLHNAMTEIAINPASSNIVYVSGDGKITKSTNYGDTWFSSYNGLQSNLGCYCVTINPINPQILLTSNDSGIYRSTDAGQNWNKVFGTTCRRIAFHPNFQGVAAGITFSPYKVLLSTNFGLTWLDSTSSFPGSTMIDLAFSKYDNNLYVASAANGIYKRLFMLTGISKEENHIPSGFKLFQNYPNPFNQSSIIKFQIPNKEVRSQKSEVRIIIYDILGNEIQMLVNEELQPGTYEVTFDGSNYPSGVYYYQLLFGDFKETKKLILLK
jgi:hypothetical protein